jgi:uncharacterized membrane protein (UPF0127 family)
VFSLSQNRTTKAILILGVAFVAIVGGLWLGFSSYPLTPKQADKLAQNAASSTVSLFINGTAFAADVVATAALREQGLSGRECLGSNEAMLFVFPTNGNYGFWMKDMKFSIDIIWADENGSIVYIQEHATPDSFFKNPPQAFIPTAPARVVVEVADGTVKNLKIKTGDLLIFDTNILKNASN